MKADVSHYGSLVFDCDGVVLDSNKVKTQAFYTAALPYGEAAANALVSHHVANGGISRYKKFAYFIDELVPKFASDIKGPDLDGLLAVYADAVQEGLLNCAVAAGLQELRAATPNARWLIVSGGDQAELRAVFTRRGLAAMFDGGIFGSPDTKDEILAREIALGNIGRDALFIGDSRYDHVAALAAKLDFVFVSQWTEFPDWQAYCDQQQLVHVQTVQALLFGVH